MQTWNVYVRAPNKTATGTSQPFALQRVWRYRLGLMLHPLPYFFEVKVWQHLKSCCKYASLSLTGTMHAIDSRDLLERPNTLFALR